MDKFTVIGLGRFGMTLVRRLSELGQEVIAIDNDAEHIDDVKDVASHAVTMDCTEEKALAAQGVEDSKCVIVCMGDDFEATILATLLSKKLGAKRVVSRAVRSVHDRILALAGADETVNPEEESAHRLAQRLVSPLGVEQIPLAQGYSVAQMQVPPFFVGRALQDLHVREKYRLNVVAIRRRSAPEQGGLAGGDEVIMPRADTVFAKGDVIAIVAPDDQIAELVGA